MFIYFLWSKIVLFCKIVRLVGLVIKIVKKTPYLDYSFLIIIKVKKDRIYTA